MFNFSNLSNELNKNNSENNHIALKGRAVENCQLGIDLSRVLTTFLSDYNLL